MNQDKRKNVMNENKKRKFRFELLIPAVLVIAGVIWISVRKSGDGEVNFGNAFVSYEKVKAEDGVVTLPAADFEGGKARYYRYQFPDKELFFFVVKSTDGVIRAAFDACDVCFRERKGYRQDGSIMICNNCGQQFPSNRINIEKGGCNPAPLERSVEGKNLVVQVSDLYKGTRYF